MFVVSLRFSANRSRAPELMAAHNAWIQRGFEDGVFLLTGGLNAGEGGAVLAHGLTRADLDARVAEDPFVVADVVRAEILDIAPGRTDPRLAFVKG